MHRVVPVEQDILSKVSESNLRQRRVQEEIRRVEVEELGAVGELGAAEELPQFLRSLSFMASAVEEQ